MNLMESMNNLFRTRRESDPRVLAKYIRILPNADAKKAALIKLLSKLEVSHYEYVDVDFVIDNDLESIIITLIAKVKAPAQELDEESVEEHEDW